jgi:tetratricopeptide (TPR) repeat protein
MLAKHVIAGWTLLAWVFAGLPAGAEGPPPSRGEGTRLARALERQIAKRTGATFDNLRVALARQAGAAPPPAAANVVGGDLWQARARLADGSLAEAEAALLDLRTRHPYSTTVLYDLGVLYIRRGAFREGIDTLERAVAIDPFFAAAHHELALASAQREMRERALSHATTALLIDEPGAPRAIATLKLVADLLKRFP